MIGQLRNQLAGGSQSGQLSLQGGQPGPSRLQDQPAAKAGTACPSLSARPRSFSPALGPASPLPTSRVYKLQTPSFRASAACVLYSLYPEIFSQPLPSTSGDLAEPVGTGSSGWSGQVSPERWGGAGALWAPPRDPVTPGLEFDTGRRRAGGC